MYWELGFLRVFLYTIVSPYFIVKSLQLRGRRQIVEPRKYCLVRVIVFFDVCFLYLFYFSQVEILVKFPTTRTRPNEEPKRRLLQQCLNNHSPPKGEEETIQNKKLKRVAQLLASSRKRANLNLLQGWRTLWCHPN